MDVCMGSCGPVLGRKSRLVHGNAETSAGEKDRVQGVDKQGAYVDTVVTVQGLEKQISILVGTILGTCRVGPLLISGGSV